MNNNENCRCKDIVIEFCDSDEIEIDFSQSGDINVEFDNGLNILSVKKHNELENLDYEHSGHTGFASSEQINDLVPKRLSVLPDADLAQDRSKMSVYVDNNGTPTKASIKNILSKIIRTSETKPSDMQEGEYLFKVNQQGGQNNGN